MAGFQKASKKMARLRLALIGPSGSGKTFSALRIATGFGGRVGLIDTERGSASKYADRFSFDVMELESFHPQRYIDAIHEAEKAGMEVLVIDSLSHAWSGKDGALEQVDNAAKRQKGNSFGAWREVTPLHNALVDAILRSSCHIIATMRAKTEYLVEQGSNGRQQVKKVGLAPVQRDGMEYEFDVVGDMDGASLVVTKTRCSDLDGKIVERPGEPLGKTLRAWLTDGVDAGERRAEPQQAPRESRTAEMAPSQKEEPRALSPESQAKVDKAAALLGGQVLARPTSPPVSVAFGQYKGELIRDLSDAQLSACIDLARVKLLEQPNAKWAKAMSDNLDAMEAEVEVRIRAGQAPSRQPGEEG